MVLADVDVSNSIQRGIDEVFAFIPEFLMALVIVVVGYIIAKVISSLVARVLQGAGLDEQLHRGSAGEWVRRVTPRPSRLLGTIAFWAIFLGAISLAVSVLGIDALNDFVATVYAYLPNIVAALLIFIVAGMIAAGLATLSSRMFGGTALGKLVSTAGPILVMTIATFMILDQLQIAQNIVVITYAAVLGAVALGSALAFGLGGRDVAGRMLEGAYQKGQETQEEYRRYRDQDVTRASTDGMASTQPVYAEPSRVGAGDTRIVTPDDDPAAFGGSPGSATMDEPRHRGDSRA